MFTPKGVVIYLWSKATPIDFAYRIHTDVGNKCVGAKVNGKIVPLDYTLKTGEIVEILTSPNAKGPNMDWLNIAKSNQSKSKIKLWFKKAKKEENIVKGKELFEKELKKQGVNYADIAKGDVYDRLAKRYNIHTMDDLYALIGIGSLSASSYISRLKEDNGIDKAAKEKENREILSKSIEEQIAKTARQAEPNSYGITVKGESNLMVRFAKCCSPVPGDEILGYITKGRGVSVHRKDCPNLKTLIETDGEKVVEVNWGKSQNAAYFAEIQVKADNRENLLADTMSVISDLKLQLSAVNANLAKDGYAFINIKVKITSVDNLNELMKKIKRLKGVIDVYRVNS